MMKLTLSRSIPTSCAYCWHDVRKVIERGDQFIFTCYAPSHIQEAVNDLGGVDNAWEDWEWEE